MAYTIKSIDLDCFQILSVIRRSSEVWNSSNGIYGEEVATINIL